METRPSVKRYPRAPWLFGVFLFLMAAAVYLHFLHLAGFPDGHRTELQRAEKVLFTLFIGASLVLGIFSFSLGWTNDQKNAKTLAQIIFLYILMVSAAFFVHRYLFAALDRGGGG